MAEELIIDGNFKRALDLMENTDKNIFITGKAGTGKSTLLNYFRGITKKRVAMVAPTGVAALNIRGQTIHSFFGFKPDVTLDSVQRVPNPALYRKLDMLVIDEISMVRADLLDCVDKFLRLNRKEDLPFGGLQMVFVGDLYQLPPVVTSRERMMFRRSYKSEYFFDSRAFKQLDMEFIELERHFRQTDEEFIELLNAVRNNTITDAQLERLNSRYDPDFIPGINDGYVTLVTKNDLADRINADNLARLKGRLHTFVAQIYGSFDREYLPADEVLKLKAGAQVMLVNNDSRKRWVNGSVGHVVGFGDGYIEVRLTDGSVVQVEPYEWQLTRMFYDERTDRLQSEVVGSFIQYPMILAWAITIHKSQGKTFDRVVIDTSSGVFASGQVYVALSRCRKLDGIVLRSKISRKDIRTDWRVVRFLTNFQYKKSMERMPLEEKEKLIREAIEGGKRVEIVYLKANDEKSRRIVLPEFVGMLEYRGKEYLGMRGFDSKDQGIRSFRLDRILEIRVID